MLPRCIEGYAIISADGMLAGADGIMPDALKFAGDQRFFEQGLDGASAVAHGAHSHEQQTRSHLRRRLILTRRVATLAPDASNAKALLWNPAGASFEDAWTALGADGTLAVIGGTEVFGLFLPRYDVFYLSHAPHVRLPRGRPVFPGVPARTPDAMLSSHGLVPGSVQVLDAANEVTVTTWQRVQRATG
jgi:dihydrofolate reductase